jgi:hypothetical protein
MSISSRLLIHSHIGTLYLYDRQDLSGRKRRAPDCDVYLDSSQRCILPSNRHVLFLYRTPLRGRFNIWLHGIRKA